MNTPKANQYPHPHTLHGDVREDDYYWLRDRNNPEVIEYVEAENRYYEEMMQPLQGTTDILFDKMVARIPEAEVQVPVQQGEFFYYSRMDKSLQYPIYTRKRADSRQHLYEASEEVVLDLNALAEDGGYLSVTLQRVSPDQTHLAYLENRDGTDQYTVFVKNISTGELLPDRISNVFIHESLEWSATGDTLFYITVDESQRPYQLWRHRLGDTSADELLYEETDITYTLSLFKSRSGQYLFLKVSQKTSSEVRYLDAGQPLQPFQVLDARRPGILYEMEHWGDDFLILTNEGAQNFQLLFCPISDLSARKNLVPYVESRYLQGMYPFRGALLLSGRENGLTEVWRLHNGALERVQWNEPLYTVSLAGNRGYDMAEALIQYESLLTPKTTYALDIFTGHKHVLQVAPVSVGFDPAEYHQERLWSTADDGAQVPMTVVYRQGALDKGPAPLILNGYGSYGINNDPHFDPMRLPLLDLGLVFVTAHIRGGAEMGRGWYEDGKLLKKRNTFTDFIAAAQDLIGRGYTTPNQLVARGGSAGGLLVGAVANMAGDLFKVITPAVPFVDVVTTMLDATIPLTSLEWDEWGNPEEEEYYFYMKSYSPYDNVCAKDYPHLYVTTGLNDPRVAYWEPAKWVARLREMKTDSNVLLLKTNMGAGHFGASGRFNHLKEVAAGYAFILDKIGVTVE